MGILRRARLAAAAGVAAALLVASPYPHAFAQTTSLATAVKAAYLYKFAPFVDWPTQAFAGPASPFVLCVVGQDPFGPLLDRAVSGQHVAGRAIVISRLASASHAMPCQIAFLGGSRTQSIPQALQVLHGAPVLTVTDGHSPAGVVDFAVAADRVRFRINDEEAAEDGLTISSKLLDLALKVTPKKATGANP